MLRYWLLLVGLLVSMGFFASVQAADDAGQDGVGLNVTMGLGGVWKVGFPTRMKVEFSASDKPVRGQIEIGTVDGDGIQVTYTSPDWQVDLPKPTSETFEVYVPHGRPGHPITVRVVDSKGKELYSHNVTVAERGEVLPASQPWVVSFGGDLKFNQTTLRSGQGELPTFSTSSLIARADVPLHAQAYAGVDIIGISTLDASFIEGLSEHQGNAIKDWVHGGGRGLVSLGSSADRLKKVDWLQALLPGPVMGTIEEVDPGSLEQWLGSQKPLRPLTCAHLDARNGSVDLWMQTMSRQRIPLFIRSSHGLGQVVVIATDLDVSPMAEWPDRRGIFDRAFKGAWDQSTRTQARSGDETSNVGFDDLTGQLRASLDVFPRVKQTDLTFLAIILTVFLFIIGPLDYFLFIRIWKRPAATWWTLGLSAVTACLGIGWIATQWKPKMTQVNQLVVWDLDYATQMARGQAWMNLYSGAGGRYRLQAKATPFWDSSARNPHPVRLDWMGMPGSGLGGFESSVPSDRGMTGYRNVLSANAMRSTNALVSENSQPPEKTAVAGITVVPAGEADAQQTTASTLEELGVPTAGTKALQASWRLPCKLDAQTNQLRVQAGSSDYLNGQWTNPLPIDLLDSVMLYRGLQYGLPTRVRAGQTITIAMSTSSKDFTRQIQRRRMVEGSEKGTPWNPLQRDDLGWLCEILSFYRAAGGSAYTGLSHRYLIQQDLSELLRLDRAIVFGKISSPGLEWFAERNGQPVQVEAGEQSQWVRLIMPVLTK